MNSGSFRFGCNLAGDAGISMCRMMIMPARERIAACTPCHFSRANGAAVEESCPGPVRLAQVMDRRMPHSHKTPVVACGNIEHRDIAFDLAVPPAKARSDGVADENGPGIDDPLDEGRMSERGMTVAVQHDDCAGPAVHGRVHSGRLPLSTRYKHLPAGRYPNGYEHKVRIPGWTWPLPAIAGKGLSCCLRPELKRQCAYRSCTACPAGCGKKTRLSSTVSSPPLARGF